MAGKEFRITILGIGKTIEGGFESEEELREIVSYIENMMGEIAQLFGKSERVFETHLRDTALFTLILRMAYDYYKLKQEKIKIEKELLSRLEEALSIVEKIK